MDAEAGDQSERFLQPGRTPDPRPRRVQAGLCFINAEPRAQDTLRETFTLTQFKLHFIIHVFIP